MILVTGSTGREPELEGCSRIGMWSRIEVGGIQNWRVGSDATPEPLDYSADLFLT